MWFFNFAYVSNIKKDISLSKNNYIQHIFLDSGTTPGVINIDLKKIEIEKSTKKFTQKWSYKTLNDLWNFAFI